MTDCLNARLDLNIRVANLDASCEWYERIFGAPPIFKGRDRSLQGAANSMVCFRLGGVKLWLLPDKKGARVSGVQRVGIALMVRTPLGPLRKELASRGAAFDDTPLLGFPIDDDGVRRHGGIMADEGAVAFTARVAAPRVRDALVLRTVAGRKLASV